MSTLFPVFRTARYNTKHDPFTLPSLFDDLLNFDDHPKSKYSNNYYGPRANILKTDIGYSVELAAPGYSRDEFIMTVENNFLIISLETEDSKIYKDKLLHREYSLETFKRKFSLPENTNVEGITARYEAGILYVDVPAQDLGQKKRTITVE